MINLFPYVLAIATSDAVAVFLSSAFICTFMQFKEQPPLWIMPCLTAFHFSDFVFHISQWHANMSKLSMPNISFPSNLTASFLMITLPMLLTNIHLRSAIKDSLMLKDRFAIPEAMILPLLKFQNLTRSNWFWSNPLGLCVMITFCLVPFIPLVVLRECSASISYHSLFQCISSLGCQIM